MKSPSLANDLPSALAADHWFSCEAELVDALREAAAMLRESECERGEQLGVIARVSEPRE